MSIDGVVEEFDGVIVMLFNPLTGICLDLDFVLVKVEVADLSFAGLAGTVIFLIVKYEN